MQVFGYSGIHGVADEVGTKHLPVTSGKRVCIHARTPFGYGLLGIVRSQFPEF